MRMPFTKSTPEGRIFFQAYKIIEEIIESSEIIDSISTIHLSQTYKRNSYLVSDENFFNSLCQNLVELGKQYKEITGKDKLPKIFIPPILYKNVKSVTTYINKAYSKKILTYDDYAGRELKKLHNELMESKVPQSQIDLEIKNLREQLKKQQEKYNAKLAIIRLSSCDFRAKLRDDEKEIKRITLREQGTFFLGKPKFYEQPPKSTRNDLYENRNGIYQINAEVYLSDLEDPTLI